MKAFIHECDKNGKDKSLGTFTNWVTNEYKNWENLLHFAFKDVKPGYYRIEAFYDWGNRYGDCDIEKVIYIN